MLWILPLAPLVGAALVLAAGLFARRYAPGWVSVLVAVVGVGTLVLTLAVACMLVFGGVPGVPHTVTAEWPWWGSHLAPRLALVGISRVMVVLVPAIAAPVALYAAASMREDPGLPRLVALLTAFTGAMELLVTAGDLLTLIVGWELVGACSWALIGYQWQEAWRVSDARTAFVVTRAGDLGLYLAAAVLFSASGSLSFDAIGGLHGTALSVVAAGVLLAAAAKSAQLPFSPWLFAAMAGPIPASALLHSATMVAAGAYLLARLEPALSAAVWLGPIVVAVGLATALAGGVVASIHSDLKKVLAASTSAQYGLMFVAVGAGFTGVAGIHLVAHAAFKALLFLGAGVVLHAAGTLDLRMLRGSRLGRALPLLASLFAVGTLALAAVPPLGGAYSKEQIVAAAAERSVWLALGVLVTGLLTAFYAIRLQLLTFGAGTARHHHTAGGLAVEASHAGPASRCLAGELVSISLLAVLSVALGLLWLPGGRPLVERAIGGRLASGAGWELGASLGSIAVAAGACWLLWRRAALLTVGLPESARERTADWLGLPAMARRLVADPVLALARSLAAGDDRVVDAGIRAAARVAALLSRALGWWGERGVDGLVAVLTHGANDLATASRRVDDAGVDAAVEGLARNIGVAGTESRRLQTGLAHQYYLILAVGVVVVVAAATAGVIWER